LAEEIMRKSTVAVLLGALMLAVVPGSAFTAEQIVLRVAVPIPRTQEVAIEAKKYNDKLAALTNNAVSVKIYWGGAAGDDVDVLRKMRAGQMDGAPLSLELMSQFVRQSLVLASPALFNNYKQVDAVRAALTPAMEKEAYDNGFKVMAWADVGRLRLLSKKPIAERDAQRVLPRRGRDRRAAGHRRGLRRPADQHDRCGVGFGADRGGAAVA
jgi:TRAP-type C4-dicarboxylate transport system substrate-binding protein